MILNIILLVIGFGLLIVGANSLVHSASFIAKRFGISELVIGFTVVAIGTSAPEIFVSVISSLKGNSDLIIGNVLGSNLFNMFFILGLGGIIANNILVKSRAVKFQIPFAIISMFILFLLGNSYYGFNEGISRIDGIILLVLFIIYIIYSIWAGKKDKILSGEHIKKLLSKFQKQESMKKIILYFVLGLTALFVGGEFVVNNAVSIANMLGISERVISVTVIAIGTSLPELVTDMVALKKGKVDFIIGDLIGSSIFNVLLVVGLSATINPIPFLTSFNHEIFYIMGGGLILITAMFTGKKFKLERWEASILLILYIFFMIMFLIK